MEQERKNFHFVEYTALRQELVSHQHRQGNSVIYSLTANAFVIAWLTSGSHKGTLNFLILCGAWIPLLVSLMGLIFYMYATRDVGRIAEYCKKLETKFGSSDLGWENTSKDRKTRIRSKYVFYPIFALQIFLSIAIGMLVSANFQSL
jgi:hypothetical protein